MSIKLNKTLMDFEAVHLMNTLVKYYQQDAAEFYKTETEKKGKLSESTRFNFYPLAKKMFDDIPPERLPMMYVLLFHQCDYVATKRGQNVVTVPGYPMGNLNMRDLIVSVIVPYQLPRSVRADNGKKNGKKGKKNFVRVQPRVIFSEEEAKELFKRFIHLHLTSENNHWKQMKYCLMPDRDPSDTAIFGPIAQDFINRGDVSTAALNFLLKDSVINQFLGPEVVLHAIYIGPVKASAIEIFAQNRDHEFRRRCRDMVNLAERAMYSEYEWANIRPPNIMPEFFQLWSFSDFREHTAQVINDLRGVPKEFVPINTGWAYSAIKKFGGRAYYDKTWHPENFYDLIWTVLAQRPALKQSVINILEKDFHDYTAARFWRNMQPQQMNRIFIINRDETRLTNLLEPSSEYLNFMPYVKGIKMASTVEDLVEIRGKIGARLTDETKTCYLGLDAEWSAFTGESKASILQIAVEDMVYIVDIDGLASMPQLRNFFCYIFMHPQILKIGFQFAEDLTQMRNAVQNCVSLYEPKNVVCVGRIFADLLDMTEKREDGQEILEEICPNLSNEKFDDEKDENENGAEENGRRRDDDEGGRPAAAVSSRETVVQRTLNKGLSHLCEQVLGKPLDKREQCSVWDRRPLRATQMRYAAMDAHCILMLFDVCGKWCERLGTNVNDLIARQPPMRCSPPLFTDTYP